MKMKFNLIFRAAMVVFVKQVVSDWTQIGSEIDGEVSGNAVAMSSNGNVIAIGGNGGIDSLKGHVRVYRYINEDWEQLGSNIDGEGGLDKSGSALAMSSDGDVIAIGGPWNDGNGNQSGHVRVYRYVNEDWEQLGSDIDGKAQDVESGSALAVSSDGNVIAIGAPRNDGNGNQSGHVRVYRYINEDWEQLGFDIDGEANDDKSGSAVAMSDDGSVIAIGAPWNDGNCNQSGHVRVYANNGNDLWIQLGSDIDGESTADNFGWAVSMSSDGSRIAIGAVYHSDNNLLFSGHVRAYRFINGDWEQLGSDIDGEASRDYFGSAVAMSSDGNAIAIGAPWNDGNGNNSGHVRVFCYINGDWEQLGADVDGEANDDKSGSAVAISSDGSVIAIGAPRDVDDMIGLGHVRVFSMTPSGKGNADPHFTTFSGMSFDYHGECDLVMLASPGFASDSGLLIHIRTKRVDGRLFSYSYISAVAVRIGNDILEIQEDGILIVNGKLYTGDVTCDGGPFPTEFATYSLTKNMIGKLKKITQYVLNIDRVGNESKYPNMSMKPRTITIHANPRTRMLSVKIDGYFHDGVGLLGEPLAGDRLLGRDGITDMSQDWNKYGEEWQVKNTEPRLFQDHRAPQYPDPCTYQDGKLMMTHNLRHRHLAYIENGMGLVTKEAASEACSNYNGVNKNNCIHDVMALEDLEVAEDPAYI